MQNNIQRQILKSARSSAQTILAEVDNLKSFVINREIDNEDRRNAYTQVKTIRNRACAILATDDGSTGCDQAEANIGLLDALLDEVICGELGQMTAHQRCNMMSKLAKACESVHVKVGLKEVRSGDGFGLGKTSGEAA